MLGGPGRAKSSHGQPQQILAPEAAVNVSFGRSRSQTDMTAFALAGTLASWRRMRGRESHVMMRIIQGDLGDPRVVGLLQIHLTNARGATAPGSAHALDISGLQSPDISFWTIWDDEMLLGMGALKRLSADHGEINPRASSRG